MDSEAVLTDISSVVSSCTAYSQAVDTLLGALETDVRTAAQHCWQLRERPVQVRAGLSHGPSFVRSKMVVVQEAVFSEDAERHRLGAALAQWQEAAEGAVAAAALDVKVAEQRALLGVMSPEAQRGPADWLLILDALLAAYGVVAVVPRQGLQGTLDHLKELALYAATAYLAAQGGLPALAVVLQKHAAAAEWTAALLQPDAEAVLPVLEAMGAEEGADPAAVLALLAQCPLSAVPAAAGPALLQALLRLAPTTQQDRGGAQELYDALLGTLRQLAGRDEGLGAEVADATLQLLLATARSVPVQGLPAALGLPAPEGAAPFRLASVDLATLATSIFSPLSRPAVDPLALALPMHLARQLDWRGLAGVPKLATRALLALVALARAAAAAGAAASAPAAGARSARDDPAKAELKELRPFVEAVLAAGEAAGPGGGEGGAEGGLDEGECYLLCMLEAPVEQPVVEAVWLQIQLSTACTLCCRWLAAGRGAAPAVDLLGGMQLEDKAWRLSATAGGAAAVEVAARLVRHAAQPDGSTLVDALAGTLCTMLGAALATQGQQAQQAVAAMQQAVAEAVRGCLAARRAQQAQQQPIALDEQLAMLAVGEGGGSTGGGANDAKPDAQQEDASGNAAYACICAWLALLLQLLGSSPGLPSGLLLLLDRLTQAAYYLLDPALSAGPASEAAAADTRLWLLSSSLAQLAERVGEGRLMSLQQRLFQLCTTTVAEGAGGGSGGGPAAPETRLSWLALLACWLLDSLALRAALKAEEAAASGPGAAAVAPTGGEPAAAGAAQPGGGREAVLGVLRGTSQRGVAAASDRVIEEALQVQEAAGHVRDSPAAVPLWCEFFLRYTRHREVLEALVSREDLLISLSTLSQQYYHASGALAAALSRLSGAAQGPLPGAGGGEGPGGAGGQALAPFLGDPVAVQELGRVHGAWSYWATAGAAGTAGAGGPDAAGAAAAVAVDALLGSLLPPAQAPLDAGQLAELEARKGELWKKLEEAEGLLRFWARRGEKQVVGTSEDGSGSEGGTQKEGDVPELIAEPQAKLWESSAKLQEALSTLATQLRSLVCTRFKPLDVAQLQAHGEEFQDGQRMPAPEDPNHTQLFLEGRLRARGLALHIIAEANLAVAASDLQFTEHILLRSRFADLPPDQAASVRSALLMTVAEVLLDGSTPPVAAPFLTELFERAVGTGAVALTAESKRRLVPRISRAMRSGAGPRRGLREREAVVLLRASLDPEALLEAGKLREFYDTLLSVLGMCRDVAEDTAASLLRSFDGTRFAVMALEGGPTVAGAGGGLDEGEGSSSSAAPQGTGRAKPPGLDSVLEAAALCLGQAGAEATGAALIEGLLCVAPAPCFACCLQVALVSRPSDALRAALGMLCKVPAGMLPPAVIAEALAQVTEAFENNLIKAPDIPYDLLRLLLSDGSVLASVHASVEGGAQPDTAASADRPVGGTKLWTVKLGAGEVERGPGGGEGAGSSSTAAPGATDPAPSPAPPKLLLLPVPTSGVPPLHELSARMVGAALQSLLRTLGSGVDGEALADQLLQLLGTVFEPVGASGPWFMAWLWRLYKEAFHPFLSLAGRVSDGFATAAFRQCWSSLPWSKATFHAAAPAALAELRAYLPSGDRAAVELLHGLDWALVLSKVHPPRGAALGPAGGAAAVGVYSLGDEEEEAMQGLSPGTSMGAAPSPVAGKEAQRAWAAQLGLLALQAGVLLRKEDLPEWLALLLYGGTPGGQAAAVAGEAATGAADLAGLLGGQSGDVAATLLQDWLDSAGRGRPPLPLLLAEADWAVVEAAVTSEPGGVPWLALPLAMSPQIIGGDVAARVVHVAMLLGDAAMREGSPWASATAARAVQPLLLFSLCQGGQVPQAAPGALAAPPQQVQAQQAQQAPLLELPPDIPPELLEGTVEGQQLRAQQAQQEAQQAEQGGHLVAASGGAAQHAQRAQQEGAAGAAAAAAEHGQPLPLVEVLGCWHLGAPEQLALVESVLLPLASRHAKEDLLPSVHSSSCPEFKLPLGPGSGEGAATPAGELEAAGISTWQPPLPAELTGQAAALDSSGRGGQAGDGSSSAAGAAGAGAEASGASRGALSLGGDPVRARVAVLAALVQAAFQPPATVLTDDPLPFGNAQLPWDTPAALYVSVEGGGGARRPAGAGRSGRLGQQFRAMGRRLTSLMHHSDDSRAAAAGSSGAAAGTAAGPAAAVDPDAALRAIHDVQGVHNLLGSAIEDFCYPSVSGPLAACVLRVVLACPALHACPQALALADNLLRHFASPHGAPAHHDPTHPRGLMRRHASSSSLASAVTIPVIPASHAATTVTHTAEGPPSEGGDELGFGLEGAGGPLMPGEVAVPEAMRHAVATAEGLPHEALLGAAGGAAAARRPLLAAFACARLRAAAMLLDKAPWQQMVIEVLRVGVAADSDPDQPFEVVAVWLEMMGWVADSRWRRLQPGPHHDALREFLDVLNVRIVVLKVLSPEQQAAEQAQQAPHAGQGGSPTGLQALGDKLRAMAHTLPGLRPDGDQPSQEQQQQLQQPQQPLPTAGGEREGEGARLGSRMAKGFKSMLGRGGRGEEEQGPEGSPKKKGPFAGLRAKLSRPGGAEAPGPSAAGQPTGTPILPGMAVASHPGVPAAATGQEGSTGGVGVPPPPLLPEPGEPAAPGGEERSGAVRQRLSTGLQRVGDKLSAVRTRLGASASGRRLTEADVQAAAAQERERDVLVRLGLAAFAVSAFIKMVLCPSLPKQASVGAGMGLPAQPSLGLARHPSGGGLPGQGSLGVGPDTPTMRNLAAQHGHHRTASGVGFEELMLRELDLVLEARSELDLLDSLAHSSLVAANPGPYAPFIQAAPRLLSASVGLEAFQGELGGRLLEGVCGPLLAVLRA